MKRTTRERKMKIDELIYKYEQKLLVYERHVRNNSGSTKYLCLAQCELCQEVLSDLKGETVINIRKKRVVTKKKYRPAVRIQT